MAHIRHPLDLRGALDDWTEELKVTLKQESGTVNTPYVTQQKYVPPSKDPAKLAQAKERLQAITKSKKVAFEFVKKVAEAVGKPGDTFEDKIAHALAVKQAVSYSSLYAALNEYFDSIGIKDPSELGIWESAARNRRRSTLTEDAETSDKTRISPDMVNRILDAVFEEGIKGPKGARRAVRKCAEALDVDIEQYPEDFRFLVKQALFERDLMPESSELALADLIDSVVR